MREECGRPRHSSRIFFQPRWNVDLLVDGRDLYCAGIRCPSVCGKTILALSVLIVTSKGAAGVTGSGFIVLAGTLAATHVVPVEGMALLLGVDRFMSEARAITNVIGNAVATVVVAKSED